MMRIYILMALSALIVAGCSRSDDRIRFDGEVYRAKANFVDRDDRRAFTASVTPVSASLEGAREAGRYEGVKYCIEEYGTSKIAWSASPDDEPQAWSIDRDTVTFAGRCQP